MISCSAPISRDARLLLTIVSVMLTLSIQVTDTSRKAAYEAFEKRDPTPQLYHGLCMISVTNETLQGMSFEEYN